MLKATGVPTIAAMAGCLGELTDDDNEADPSVPSGDLEEIGISTVSGAGAWVTAFNEGGEVFCQGRDEFECEQFIFQRETDDISAQVNDIRQMINQDVDGIVVVPWGDALIDVIEEATYDHGIPVFTADADVETDAVKTNTGLGQETAGERCGELMMEYLEEQNPDQDNYEILHVRGSFIGIANQRSIGFDRVIDEQDNAEIVDTLNSEWLRETAQSEVQTWIESNGPPDGIYTSNLSAGLGALGGLETHDIALPQDHDDHVTLVTIDGSPEVNREVQDGFIDAAVDQANYFYIPLAIRQMEMWYENGGDEALPGRGETLTEEDIPIEPREFQGTDLFSEPIWAPADVVPHNQHLQVKTQEITITQQNADDPHLYGNIWGEQ